MAIVGIVVTIIYIAAITFLRWTSFPDLRTMPLNEFGDFLAGVFGPLMLFWVIIGYMQQQKELRQNTRALELQAEELRKSVEQHTEMAKAANRQVHIEEVKVQRAIKPNFIIQNRTESNGYHVIALKNLGAKATNLTISATPSLEVLCEHSLYAMALGNNPSNPAQKLESDELDNEEEYEFYISASELDLVIIDGLSIEYTDAVGNQGKQKIELKIPSI